MLSPADSTWNRKKGGGGGGGGELIGLAREKGEGGVVPEDREWKEREIRERKGGGGGGGD